jgi:glutaredoxin
MKSIRTRPVLAAASAGLLVLLGACDASPPTGQTTGSAVSQPSSGGAKHSAASVSTRNGSQPSLPRLASVDASEVRRVYYQFVDTSGAVRFVPTLDAVPPEWRKRVGFVEMTAPPPQTPADAQRIRQARANRAARVSATAPGASDENEQGSGAQVVLYSADWCGVCRRAKQYMDEHGIRYDERNIDEPRWRDEMTAKAGPGGIPVFDVGGQILRGFSPERLEQMLKSAS